MSRSTSCSRHGTPGFEIWRDCCTKLEPLEPAPKEKVRDRSNDSRSILTPETRHSLRGFGFLGTGTGIDHGFEWFGEPRLHDLFALVFVGVLASLFAWLGPKVVKKRRGLLLFHL